MENKRFIVYAGFVVLAFFGLFKLHQLGQRLDEETVPAGVVPHGFTRRDVTLRPDEAARVVLRPDHLAVVRRDGTKTEYVPEGARVEVSISTHGVVAVSVQHKGLCFSPGIGVTYTGRLSVVLDARLGYWDRLSLLGGVNVRPLMPYVGVGFNIFKRTSLFVGRGTKTYLAGLRVSF